MREENDRQRGQSLAELALVMPLLMMILVAMVEVGWAMRSHLIVTTASREGARFAGRGIGYDEEQSCQDNQYYQNIEEVAEVILQSLNPIFEGAEANATIIITLVSIAADGTPTKDCAQPYVTGDLPVQSRMGAAEYDEIGENNVHFNDYHGLQSKNTLVVVEVFHDHDLLLGSRIASGWIGLGPLRLYSRSINRIGTSRYD